MNARRGRVAEFRIRQRASRWKAALMVPFLFLGSGCAGIEFYTQAVSGHLELMSKRRSLDEVISDAAIPETVRARLAIVPEVLAFAREELLLPDNGSYRDYADLNRSVVSWVVFRAPAYSVDLKQSCFPVTGCLSYQGWFDRSAAQAMADEASGSGMDVYIAPSPAYSSLGWFRDPVLNTMLRWDEATFIGVLFHELTHQRLYVPGDTGFNESLANFIEDEGVRRFLLNRSSSERWERYRQERKVRQQFRQLIVEYRGRLQAAYKQAADDTERAQVKRGLIQLLKADFQTRADQNPRWRAYGHWFAKPINNAQLASVSVYNRFGPAFRALLAEEEGDFNAFWRRVEILAKQRRQVREAELMALSDGVRPR